MHLLRSYDLRRLISLSFMWFNSFCSCCWMLAVPDLCTLLEIPFWNPISSYTGIICLIMWRNYAKHLYRKGTYGIRTNLSPLCVWRQYGSSNSNGGHHLFHCILLGNGSGRESGSVLSKGCDSLKNGHLTFIYTLLP